MKKIIKILSVLFLFNGASNLTVPQNIQTLAVKRRNDHHLNNRISGANNNNNILENLNILPVVVEDNVENSDFEDPFPPIDTSEDEDYSISSSRRSRSGRYSRYDENSSSSFYENSDENLNENSDENLNESSDENLNESSDENLNKSLHNEESSEDIDEEFKELNYLNNQKNDEIKKYEQKKIQIEQKKTLIEQLQTEIAKLENDKHEIDKKYNDVKVHLKDIANKLNDKKNKYNNKIFEECFHGNDKANFSKYKYDQIAQHLELLKSEGNETSENIKEMEEKLKNTLNCKGICDEYNDLIGEELYPLIRQEDKLLNMIYHNKKMCKELEQDIKDIETDMSYRDLFNENYFYDKVDNEALDLESQDRLNFVAQDDVLKNIVEELKESSPEFENVSNFETQSSLSFNHYIRPESSLNNIFNKSYSEDDVHKDITK